MARVHIFFGSSTGNTEQVAKLIRKELADLVESVTDIATAQASDLADAQAMILGIPTWEDGELQQDWKRFFPQLDQIDLQGKTVALFGLGDANGFSGEFVSALGTLYEKVKQRGARIVGFWPSDDYTFLHSGALQGDHFVGLVIDQENESLKTPERVKQWAALIRPHLEQAS